MRAKRDADSPAPGGTGAAGGGRTFTESARRAQIVEAAIEVIADRGYAAASFAEIARHAELSSKGLISYHFASRTELVERIVETIYAEIATFLAARLDGRRTPGEALRAFIEAQVEFTGAHRTRMRALLDIFMNGALASGPETQRAAVSPVERILRWGQETGEFRAFDVQVMATTIQRSVEGPTFLLAGDPALDVAAYARELATLFERATRADSGPVPTGDSEHTPRAATEGSPRPGQGPP